MRSTKRVLVLAVIVIAVLLIQSLGSSSSNNVVHVIEIDDATINPVTAKYISNSIDGAVASKAQCLIIKLDTPGGLLTSTRSIVKKILSSRVPVVVYISPSGSRAGSAGVFITYASNIAAMAPSTNIGAAHPVQLGSGKKNKNDIWEGLYKLLEQQRKTNSDSGNTKKEKVTEAASDDDPLSSKILHDTVAFMKSIAEERGRNVEWAVKSVTESASITEQEALKIGVVEIIAKDVGDLLSQLDGRKIMIDQDEIVLETKSAYVENIKMDFRQQFFNVLANPNIAYILMILGFYGLLYEVTHPGIGVPGILGTIFLILAFFSMQTLPTNYAGLALIILAIILFVAEANVPGFGLLTLGGLVCMILGSMLLFDSSVPLMRVSISIILAFSITTAAITLFLVRAVITAHRAKVMGGQKGIIGEKGEVKVKIVTGKEGKVFVHGELWNAIADENIEKGSKIEIVEVDSMILKVKKA